MMGREFFTAVRSHARSALTHISKPSLRRGGEREGNTIYWKDVIIEE